MTYAEKLRDPRWQKKRLKVMEYAHWRCQICGAKNLTLNVHHSYYARGKEPWQYPDGSLICICEKCHELISKQKAVEPKRISPEVETVFNAPIPDEKTTTSRFAQMRAAVMRESQDER